MSSSIRWASVFSWKSPFTVTTALSNFLASSGLPIAFSATAK